MIDRGTKHNLLKIKTTIKLRKFCCLIIESLLFDEKKRIKSNLRFKQNRYKFKTLL